MASSLFQAGTGSILEDDQARVLRLSAPPPW
jgi:hypothetical protein